VEHKVQAIPDRNATELKQKYDPVAAYLSKKPGIASP
jgi:ABC-type phosphate/phosphonate transport system substrate-binding protein